jgi:phosphoribosylformylglycinamidine synthase subunit PurL
MTTDAAIHRKLGLTDDEADRIVEMMGREPSEAELLMFSLMWSEHCSYKHSRPLLRAFPSTGDGVLQGPGENAGVVDVGDGWAVAFKIESHNHPSAVEPFQGAATGVGGIVRDIMAMGARPVALLNSLRFGELTSPRSRYLFTRAVEGIGHYGNCIGVPTVGGEVSFDDCYEESCLVNAMCVGLVRHDGMLRAAASGPGNALVLIGNRTGRDGIGGASILASAELDDDEDKRPSVQVGDPFTERKLMDCCLDLAARGLLVALQDLGAAGLTSAASEMAARGEVGLDIDLDLIPLREQRMSAGEILVSESQERMLAVVEPLRVAALVEVCTHWQLDATAIGTVTDTGSFVARMGGHVEADIPAAFLTDDAPVYGVPLVAAPAPVAIDLASLPESTDLAAAWRSLLARPNIACKRSVYEQYDQLVGAGTLRRPGSAGAAVVRIPGTGRALAITTDGAERHCQLDPRGGGASVVFEAARNLACTGASPLAITNCLNFANPEKGSTGWRLAEVIGGMSDACVALGIPVVSGNVSLYNESATRAIHPTPVVGMVGLVDETATVGIGFQEDGDVIIHVGSPDARLDASEWLGETRGAPPRPDIAVETATVRALLRATGLGLVRSAHDISAGGLGVALAESAIAGDLGAHVEVDGGRRADEALFGEGGGRALLTCRPRDCRDVLDAIEANGTVATVIGTVTGDQLQIRVGATNVELALAVAREAWSNGLDRAWAP